MGYRAGDNTFKSLFSGGIDTVKESDLYETPPHIFENLSRAFGPFDLDVCALKLTAKCDRFFSPHDNALDQRWEGRCWMNPPYSDPLPWISKAQNEAKFGAFIVALLPSDTSTAWYQMMKLDPNCILLHPAGRIRFHLNGMQCGSPKFGSVVAVFHPPVSWRKKK